MSSEAKTENKAVKLGVMPPPHLHWGKTIPSVMKEICLALVPALIMAVYNFGPGALTVVALSVLSSVGTEALCLKVMKRDLRLDDFHAVYLGLMLGFMLPADAPLWLPVIGGVISVGLGKMVFGGLGANPFCPPAIGWAVLMICWPTLVDASSVVLNNDFLDPLFRLKYFGVADATSSFTYGSLLLGQQMGGLGSSQVGALIAGGIIAALRMDISFETPLGFIIGIYLLGGLMNLAAPEVYAPATFHLLSGSAVFGAFFLATEFGGSPSRPVPKLLYGMIIGMLTVIIRTFGQYTDGVAFAVLLGNLVMPFLDKIRPKPFGSVK